MAKRKYTKKSNYWNKFHKKSVASLPPVEPLEPATAGEAYHVSEASYNRAGTVSNLSSKNTSTRINRSSVTPPRNKYSQIRAGLLPYEISSDGINVREAIELCQKAYANVPIFRNTIDMMSEFANSEIYLEGGNATSRNFFEKSSLSLFIKICALPFIPDNGLYSKKLSPRINTVMSSSDRCSSA